MGLILVGLLLSSSLAAISVQTSLPFDRKNIERELEKDYSAICKSMKENTEETLQDMIDYLAEREEQRFRDLKQVELLMVLGSAELGIPEHAIKLFNESKDRGLKTISVAGGIGKGTLDLIDRVYREKEKYPSVLFECNEFGYPIKRKNCSYNVACSAKKSKSKYS